MGWGCRTSELRSAEIPKYVSTKTVALWSSSFLLGALYRDTFQYISMPMTDPYVWYICQHLGYIDGGHVAIFLAYIRIRHGLWHIITCITSCSPWSFQTYYMAPGGTMFKPWPSHGSMMNLPLKLWVISHGGVLFLFLFCEVDLVSSSQLPWIFSIP